MSKSHHLAWGDSITMVTEEGGCNIPHWHCNEICYLPDQQCGELSPPTQLFRFKSLNEKADKHISMTKSLWMSIRRLNFKRRQMKSRHVIYQASSNQLIINVRPFCSRKQYRNTPIRQTLWPVAGKVCNTKYLFITAPVGGCNIFGGNWTFWAQNWCLRSGMGNQGLEWVC